MKNLLVLLAVLALAGCGAAQKSAETATETPQSADAPAGDAAVAAAPQLIEELTDQNLVYECPKCGMMFDAAGTCSMGCAELVATEVSYVCPADNQAVEKAGKCPRCPMNARVEKTALASAAPTESH